MASRIISHPKHVCNDLGTLMSRRGWRSWDGSDRSIFPLELVLGLTAGVSPGLADWLGREMVSWTSGLILQ